jgi:hypothetical protein
MFRKPPSISLSVALEVRAVSPRGEGVLYIDGVFVAYDPLHNTLNLNHKDLFQ